MDAPRGTVLSEISQRTTHTVRSVSSWELELHPKPRVRGGRRGRGLTGGRSGRVGQLKSERREARRGDSGRWSCRMSGQRRERTPKALIAGEEVTTVRGGGR